MLRTTPPPEKSTQFANSTQETKYRPKNILLTGGAGFLGSHVATYLVSNYGSYRVIVVDKLERCATLNNLRGVKDFLNFKFVRGDILSSDFLAYILGTEEIDTVLHFAAATHVENSFGNSLEFTQNNTQGTHVLLEACRKYGGIRRFVNVSTDEVYGVSSCPGQESSESRIEPTNPYSAAKAAAEMISLAYHTSYNLPIITTRGNNVYGPKEFPEKMVSKFILLALQGKKLPLHGSGKAVRSYLYVDDVAEAFDVILHRGLPGETYNIGSSEARSVKSVAEDICMQMGLDPQECLEGVSDRKFTDTRYLASDRKLLALGWKQQTSWECGLQKTIEWYTENGETAYWDNADLEQALTSEICRPAATSRRT